MNPQAMLEVQGLSKRFGTAFALQGIHLQVRPGEVLGLIGPNGAGKTTLFTCLVGLLPLDVGELRWRGEPIPVGRIKEHLFFLPDGIAPWPAQRLGDLLDFAEGYFGAAHCLRPSLEDGLDLGGLKPQRLGELSKGQRKRAMLAFALLTPQPLLLLDEPFDGLDLLQTRGVMKLLRGQAAEGRTLFLSIHQLLDAERACDRLVLLSGGRVVGEGTPEELKADAGVATLEEVFFARA